MAANAGLGGPVAQMILSIMRESTGPDTPMA